MNAVNEDARRLTALAEYYDAEATDLGVCTADQFVPAVSTKDRRRRRLRGDEDRTGALVLVKGSDGVLRWDVGGARRRAARRRAGRASRAGLWSWLTGDEEQVAELHFELLPPNEIIAAISKLDRKFAAASLGVDAGGAPAFGLRRWRSGKLAPVAAPTAVEKGKRILLFVHGTFSNCDHFLVDEFLSTKQGRELVASKRFDEVLTFDHPTLAVSPMLNAFELSRLMRGVQAEVCVVAHSRGGLVTRWWLEGFGGAEDGPRKAVLVGSPLAGTSLASPARIRESMDLLTNVGNALKLAGSAATAFAPLLAAPVVLLKVFTSITSALSKLPIADAGVALVPGLGAQSRVGNNHELLRLRAARPNRLPSYFVVRSNFEPADVGWKFWRLFRKDQLADAAVDTVFPGENDLVVDTESMDDVFTDAAVPRPKIIHDFGTNPTVHHINYFRQRETIDAIAGVL
ncbi:MAG: hypothetical protein IT453_07300 [Planctomycetes bacterium]|nr:hypothetical protein [Planctomycetota bacterium]